MDEPSGLGVTGGLWAAMGATACGPSYLPPGHCPVQLPQRFATGDGVRTRLSVYQPEVRPDRPDGDVGDVLAEELGGAHSCVDEAFGDC